MNNITKMKTCILCESVEITEYYNGVADKPETFKAYPNSNENNPDRQMYLCKNCYSVIENVATDVVKKMMKNEKESKAKKK